MASRRHRKGGRYTPPKCEQVPGDVEGYVIVPGPHGEPEVVYDPESWEASRDWCPECQEADGHQGQGSGRAARTAAEREPESDLGLPPGPLAKMMRQECSSPVAEDVVVDVLSTGEIRVSGVCGRRVPADPVGWVFSVEGWAACPEHSADFED